MSWWCTWITAKENRRLVECSRLNIDKRRTAAIHCCILNFAYKMQSFIANSDFIWFTRIFFWHDFCHGHLILRLCCKNRTLTFLNNFVLPLNELLLRLEVWLKNNNYIWLVKNVLFLIYNLVHAFQAINPKLSYI